MKRVLTDKQRGWLAGELEVWKSQSIVSEEQSSKILDLYESSADLSDRKRSVLLSTLMGLAALMVGLAVLLLIGYNWEEIPRGGKLFLIFGTIASTYYGAFLAEKRGVAKRMVDVLFFLGSLFYGSGIFLVAQIFHLNAHYPNGVWWWAVGVMPLALCRRSLVIHALYAFLLGLWCGMEILNFRDLGWWFFGRWPEMPNGAYSLLLLAIPGLLAGYVQRSRGAVALYVMVLTWWLTLQPITWDIGLETIYFVGAVGAFLLAIGEQHGENNAFSRPYRRLGALLAAGVLIFLSYYDANKEMFVYDSGYSYRRGFRAGIIVEMAVICALTAFTFLPSVSRSIAKLAGSDQPDVTAGELLKRQVPTIVLTGVMVVSMIWGLAMKDAVVPTILANLGMLTLSGMLIRTGLREDRGMPFTVGVLYFLLWTILRYIDLFGDFGGMLGAAGMFFACGAALFGVGRYWQKRKRGAHAH